MAHPCALILSQNVPTTTHTLYEKGAEVVRMLHTILGEDIFQQGMKNTSVATMVKPSPMMILSMRCNGSYQQHKAPRLISIS